MLRGNGSGGPVSYDVVFNRAMQPIYDGVTRIKPAIHFINGEYWGLTAIRERIDDDHYALNFGLEADNIVIIDCKVGNCVVDEGVSSDYSSYKNMRDFIIDNDMTDQTLYAQATEMLDMDTYIDHIVMLIYSGNNGYERKFWKARNPVNANQGDGKWRVAIQDFEASLHESTNWLEHWSDVTGSPNGVLLGNLLASESFKIQFVNRFADILNTVFTTSHFNNIVNETFDEVAPYLAEDANRYPKLSFYEQSEKLDLLEWGTNRPTIQKNQIKDFFAYSEVLDLVLDVSDENAGSITINTIDIKSSTPGVEQTPYPWTGQYFHSVPLTLKAVANLGSTFTHWSGDVSGTNPVLQIIPTADMQIAANFTDPGEPQEVVYFWIMDNEILNNIPLEFLDASYARNGLNASITYNSCIAGYPLTISDPMWRKASLERKNLPTELNYSSEANNNVAYANANIRGVQVRQPFRVGNLENNLVFDVPTTQYENISLSLAVTSNGGAEILLLEYWDGSQWITNNIPNPSQAITTDYQILEFDLSNVALAEDNPNFRIRMRFDGLDMTVDNSDEVIINNIALSGGKILSTDNFDPFSTVKVYPNPTSTLVNIETSVKVDAISVYSIYGQEVYKYYPKELKSQINMEAFTSGIYLVKVVSNNSEKTLRIIKR